MRYLDWDEGLGTGSAGELAGLVGLSTNPLEDTAATHDILLVDADGRVYDRAQLDELLAGIEAFSRGS